MRTAAGTLVFVLGLLTAHAEALDPARALTQYGQDVWQVEQGLPQNAVQAIVQTRDGYLWLGTQEGLARFDGVRFVAFDRKNTPALRHNSIQALLEGRDGTLWIATFNGGVTRLRDGVFTTYTTREGLPDDQVLALHEDRQGVLWIGTRAGLARFANGRFTVFTTASGLLDNRVWCLQEDRQGALWIGTDAGLSRLAEGRFTSLTAREGLPAGQVHAVLEDRRGVLWVGTYAGLARVEGGRVSAVYTEHDGLVSDLVWSLSVDRGGLLWIASAAGITRYDGTTFSSLSPQEGLVSGSVRAIVEDREGSVWIGTNGGGLARLRDGKFTAITRREGLAHDITRCVLQDRQGALWVGTNAGLNRVLKGVTTRYAQAEGFVDAPVFSLFEDRAGALWIGTYGAGLWRLADGRFTAFRTRDGLSSDVVRAIHEDRQGQLWIGTEAGLNVLRAGRFTVYGKSDGLPSDQVFVILEDRAGTLWFGTNGGGLVRHRDGRFTALGSAQGLRSPVVFALHEDAQGTLWIGTDGGGLNLLRGGRIFAVGSAEGLKDDLVVQILEDGKGVLWMSSNRGVFTVAKQEVEDLLAGRIAAVHSAGYGVADGMPSAECHGGSQPAGARTADGRLWFPTLKGLAVVDPARLRVNAVPPPVAIEEVRVDRRATDLRAHPTVPPGQRDFEFQYTALSFLAPDKLQFQYRLEGLEPSWIDAGNRRVAYYTRLPPGRYRFHVRAANSDGAWNEKGDAVDFTVEPRLIERRTFQAFLGALALGGVLLGHRMRTRHLRSRQQELELLVDARTSDLREARTQEEEARRRAEEASRAKTRFLANMSHELRTPLTAILGFVELMERLPGRAEDDQEHLAIVQRSGEHLLSLINEVLSISQIEAGQMPLRESVFALPPLLHDLHELFAKRAKTRGLALRFDAASDLPAWVKGDGGKLRQILINLLGNAVKFTPSGEVTLRASWHEGMGQIEVDDTGPGISEAEQARLFAPFAQGAAGPVHEGTGLGLAISRSYARLMGGELGLRSAPGLGSVFHLTVPLPPADAPNAAPGAPTVPEMPHLDRPFRILVVDDTAENRLLMARIHGVVGLGVRQANDGREALEQWKTFVPDLIWMDTQMPGMDGPTATREIRRLEQEAGAGAHVSIIAVTAGVLDAEERVLLDAGYDAVVPKPFRSQTIFDLLQRHLSAVAGRQG